MGDKTPVLPPPSEPFPGSKTPGWNDPPTLQYNTGPSAGKPRLNLNKRVAFPLQSGNAKPTAIVQPSQSTTSASLGVCGLPPLSMPPTSTQPIAVVHPMHTPSSSANISLPPPPPPHSSTNTNLPRVPLCSTNAPSAAIAPAAAAEEMSHTTAAMAAGTIIETTTSPLYETTGSNQVPTMLVPAMPRQESTERETRSSVQHI